MYKIGEVIDKVLKEKDAMFTSENLIIGYNRLDASVKIINKQGRGFDEVRGWMKEELFTREARRVSFKEAVESGALIRVSLGKFSLGYQTLDKLLYYLATQMSEEEMRVVIKNGIWGVKDDERD